MLPPESRPTGVFRLGVRTSYSRTSWAARLSISARCSTPLRQNGGRADLLEEEVDRDREGSDRAFAEPVVGQVAKTSLAAFADAQHLDRHCPPAAPNRRSPRAGRPAPRQVASGRCRRCRRCRGSRLDGCRTRSTTGPAHCPSARPRDPRPEAAERLRRGWCGQGARRFRIVLLLAEHQLHDLGDDLLLAECTKPLGRDLADLAAELQHRDAVAEGGGLLELVGDEDDRQAPARPGGASARPVLRCPSASASRSTRRGSGDGCCAPSRAGSRPAAARRATAPTPWHADLTVMPSVLVISATRASSSSVLGRCHHGPPSNRFSATVSVGTSIMCWKTVPMPSDSAWRGEVIGVGLPSTRMRPSSGCCRPDSMPIRRGLSGAVLAEQHMHLARANRQVDAVIGDDAGKSFRHAFKRDDVAPVDRDNEEGLLMKAPGLENMKSVRRGELVTPPVACLDRLTGRRWSSAPGRPPHHRPARP